MRKNNRPAVATFSASRRAHISRSRLIRRLAALVLVAMLVGIVPVLATTHLDITIPIESVVRGPAGSQHVLISVDVPAESQGETCHATSVSGNQVSVHPDSNLLVSSATSVQILDVESTPFGTISTGGLITLADTVTVTLTLGADRVFSGGLEVVIDCPPFNPTTSTTAAGSPSSSVGDTSTASTDGSASSTLGATTGSSQGPGETTGVTTRVLESTITAPAPSAAVSGETLPFTGITGESVGGAAFALVALGGLMVLSFRRRQTEVLVARGWRSRVDFYDVNF